MAEDHPMAGASPPTSPAIEAAVSTIDSYPQHGDDALTASTLPADAPNSDVPLSIPPTRSPSPALPSLRHVPFPPDEADNSDSDDDEVLYKLPVYMSAGLFPQVQLFQYPMNTRPIAAPEWALKRGKNVSARVKPEAGKVEVEIPIYGEVNAWRHERAKDLSFEQDTHAMNGRQGDGEGIVGGARDKRGAGARKDKKPETKWGDKVRLTSEPVPKVTGYYTGQVYDGALHLHPISKISQFRTSLAYLDDMDQKAKLARRGDEDDDKKPKQLPAPPRKGEEENDGSGSIKDFRDKMRSTNEALTRDEWIPYEWKEGDDTLPQLQELYLPEDKRVRLQCSTRGLDYLDKA